MLLASELNALARVSHAFAGCALSSANATGSDLMHGNRARACQKWFAAKYVLKLCAAEWRRSGRACPRSGHDKGRSIKQILQTSYADLSTRKKATLMKKLQQFKSLQRKAAASEKKMFAAYTKALGRNNQLKNLISQISGEAGEEGD